MDIENKKVIFYHKRPDCYNDEMDFFESTIADLIERDWIYKKDGAYWMRTTLVGDDKDRIIIRSYKGDKNEI
jgi:arginyl-tRNA synthetase